MQIRKLFLPLFLFSAFASPLFAESETATEPTQEVTDAEQRLAEARARQNSLANRAIGGVAITGGGIGGGQLAQGLAERRADQAAADEMESYRATIRCGLTGGPHNTPIDATGETPGYSQQFFTLMSDYNDTATRLRVIKEALSLPPGIESEARINTDVLYSNEAMAEIDRTGAFGNTAQQRLDDGDAQARINTGTTVAAVGIGAGLVGNVLVNHIQPELGAGNIDKELEKIQNQEPKQERADGEKTGVGNVISAVGSAVGSAGSAVGNVVGNVFSRN
ncbi:MAG: hypothetical protein FWF34_01050 [Alphaproteobacteria bacterium]|nr:hypothetical protein [Alphaproteobacteria bacterium]MCL2889831.1 hypothetical protein [Alphaproteobacteria bacterium]